MNSRGVTKLYYSTYKQALISSAGSKLNFLKHGIHVIKHLKCNYQCFKNTTERQWLLHSAMLLENFKYDYNITGLQLYGSWQCSLRAIFLWALVSFLICFGLTRTLIPWVFSTKILRHFLSHHCVLWAPYHCHWC